MKPYNIGSGQYAFLLTLYRNDGISQEELSNKLMIDKGTTARAIDKLEKAGYVVRRTNPKDRRAYNVFITDKAVELKPILYDKMGSWTDILVADLSQEERDMVYVILKKMVNSTMLHMKLN
jgi:DNA-binding MarR family transcriptional regulator